MEASLDVLLSGLMPYHSQSIILRNIVDFIPVQHAIHRLLINTFIKAFCETSVDFIDRAPRLSPFPLLAGRE